jgi:hypothetical protein
MMSCNVLYTVSLQLKKFSADARSRAKESKQKIAPTSIVDYLGKAVLFHVIRYRFVRLCFFVLVCTKYACVCFFGFDNGEKRKRLARKGQDI